MPESYTGALKRARPPAVSHDAGRRQQSASRWEAAANCAGRTALMYDHARRGEAKALCAGCPVATVCLWATIAAEADDPHPYRYGVAGGAGPLQRRRLAGDLSRSDIEARLAAAVATWREEPSRPASTPWTPPRPRYRPWRKCKGCKAPIHQPLAGRPQLWCCSACQWRTTRDRALDAARNRQRWAQLPEDAKEQRRMAMRARWAALSAPGRAQLAAQRRQRRQQARAAS